MFSYDSPIGKMLIYYDRNVDRFALSINGTVFGHYINAVAAADDVYMQVTGCYEWDSLDYDGPIDLSEWETINNSSV